jgi:hypothetical protein
MYGFDYFSRNLRFNGSAKYPLFLPTSHVETLFECLGVRGLRLVLLQTLIIPGFSSGLLSRRAL